MQQHGCVRFTQCVHPKLCDTNQNLKRNIVNFIWHSFQKYKSHKGSTTHDKVLERDENFETHPEVLFL